MSCNFCSFLCLFRLSWPWHPLFFLQSFLCIAAACHLCFVFIRQHPFSSAGIAICHELDGPGIESQWTRNFPYLSRPARGPLSLLHNKYRVSFPGEKWPGSGVNHPLPSISKVKARVELYLYSLWAFTACSRANFTFTYRTSFHLFLGFSEGFLPSRLPSRILFGIMFSNILNYMRSPL